MKYGYAILVIGLLFACGEKQEKTESEPSNNNTKKEVVASISLSQSEAEKLVELPLKCIDLEYPNKLNQVIARDADLQSPEALHPAFYGCFDWHSAVHGHWSLVRLLRTFPNIAQREQMIVGLQNHITEENISGEMAYFNRPESQGFERMYGWAWLLKLSEELYLWEDSAAEKLRSDLQPLTDLIVSNVTEFLPKLQYPIRVGTHTNTAFALCMVYDYAETVKNASLKSLVVKRAKDFYVQDSNCPLSWEPSGYDFLSPCLEEADLMRRILDKDAFCAWLDDFLPRLTTSDFELAPGIVSDREDGHLVHLDGLNFSRAWCLKGLARSNSDLNYLNRIANAHIEHSLPELTADSYEGGHWLVSFALMALTD